MTSDRRRRRTGRTGLTRKSAASCASTSARRPASARPSPCSARRIAGWSAAPTRRRGGGDARPQEDRRTARRASRSFRRSTSTTAEASSPNSTSRRCWRGSPQVVLVDELAHTNTPGSKNPKRWQDVEELLDAGHHGDLDGQRPAPGKPQRRRRPDHRHRAAGEGARRGRPRRRPDRAGRHHAGSVAAQACPRQCLRTRTHRRRAVQLLPPRQPDRAARARAAVAGRPGRRRAGEIPRRQQDHRHLGGPRARRGRRHRRTGVGNVGAPGISDRVEVQRRADGGARRPRRRAVGRVRTADGQGARAGHQPRRHPAHRGRRRRAHAPCWISPAR